MEIKRYVCLPLPKVVISEHFLFSMLRLQPKLPVKLLCGDSHTGTCVWPGLQVA